MEKTWKKNQLIKFNQARISRVLQEIRKRKRKPSIAESSEKWQNEKYVVHNIEYGRKK